MRLGLYICHCGLNIAGVMPFPHDADGNLTQGYTPADYPNLFWFFICQLILSCLDILSLAEFLPCGYPYLLGKEGYQL